MRTEEFKRILSTFADSPQDIDISKGELIVQVQDNMIEAKLDYMDGIDICVIEDGNKLLAQEWIVQRLARLDLLAGRILTFVPEEKNFVTPKGVLLDQLQNSPEERERDVDDALFEARMMLNKRLPGASSILYLTSDAGEGKTTLINQLARQQATLYKETRMNNWLLIPVPLAGRPFLRFDDVVVGALVNRLRYNMLHYDAFIELVRLGVLVPAFDGFEEMFIESTTGEALSALGNLVQLLRSSGNILISARKAYFEYKNFATQSRLFDSIESEDVAFARLALKRWDEENFIEYSKKRNISEGEQIYADVSKVFTPEHPLLTRAVLVRRLLDVATEVRDRDKLLQRLGRKPDEFFLQFVRAIIQREVTDKWIDRSGEPARPLLSIEEHHELLSMIAQEMWINSVDTLREDLLALITELFCDQKRKNPTISRQIKERIKQHALIVCPSSGKRGYAFDHEDFRHYFLGEAIGRLLVASGESELRSVLNTGPLPNHALDCAIQYFRFSNGKADKAFRLLLNLSTTENPTSFTRENVGGLIVRLLDGSEPTSPTLISKVYFPPEAILNRRLSKINFQECYFQPTGNDGSRVQSCTFDNCTFERLDLASSGYFENVEMIDCHVISICPPESDTIIFAPDMIICILQNAGFIFPKQKATKKISTGKQETDHDLILTERAIRRFLRSTTVSEGVLKAKMGASASYFIKKLLPKLEKAGLIKEHSTEAKKRHYRLGVPMQFISNSLSKCKGDFEEFLGIIQSFK